MTTSTSTEPSPRSPSPAEDYLRESASPYGLPALTDALGEVTDPQNPTRVAVPMDVADLDTVAASK